MSTQTQAYVIANDDHAVRYVRPRFRVLEGGKDADCSQKDVTSQAEQHVASGHVYTLRTRVSLVAMTAAVCIVLALVWVISDVLVAHKVSSSFEQATFETITVHSGDSLWTIADEHPVQGRTTAEVARFIREHNDLADTCLYPGMELSVPQLAQA